MSKASEEYGRARDEARRRFREEFAQWQREEDEVESPLTRFPLPALTWLALAPEWPLHVAERGFPAGGVELARGTEVRDELASIHRAHVCQSVDSDDGRGRIFWMNPAQQSSVLDLLKKLPDDEVKSHGVRNYLRQQLAGACATMLDADGEGAGLNAQLRRWAELARSAQKDEDMARLLREKVEQAIADAEQRGQVISPEALHWIRAAQPFVEWFGEPVEWAVAQAARRLELFYRRAYDKRSLKNYFPRPELERAFEGLLEGTGAAEAGGAGARPWALHYVGLGGTGKTMLMRHISTRLAKKMELAVARVDFDRLSPDYPSRAPGLLLMSFAEELRAQAADIGSDIFKRFDAEVLSLHNRIGESFRSGTPMTVRVGDPAFQHVLGLFTTAIDRLLGVKSGVVLILDTCEELARVSADNTLADSVHVTFEILEMIHRKVDRLRVVFSGRRPLAQAGHLLRVEPDGRKTFAWTCPSSRLPQRDYLRLYEIRGFTRDEALKFLRAFKGEADEDGRERGVSEALFDPIIDQSCATDEKFRSRFVRHGGPGEAAPAAEDPRYNPFELDMFAGWASSDPNLGAEQIRAGANYYVNERIVKRAEHGVRDVLPGLALLGRFDEPLMRAFIEGRGGNPDSVFPELIQSELLDVDRGANQSGTVWVVDGSMRRRLRKFYDEERPEEMRGATSTLARIMYEQTLGRDWPELSEDYFATALEVLLAEPEKAARWWAAVEARLAREAQWAWAKRITDELLADNGLAGLVDAALGGGAGEESVLRPAILATRAAAQTHLRFTDPLTHRADLLSIWSEVLAKCERHPAPDGARRLRRRALAGMIASYRWQIGPQSRDHLNTMLELSEQLFASVSAPPVAASDEFDVASELAMLEAVAEVAEAATWDEPGDRGSQIRLGEFYERTHAGLKGRWPETLPADLRLFYRTVKGRLLMLSGRRDEGLEIIAQTLNYRGLLDQFRFGKALQCWPDWHRPDDLPARVALEYCRHADSHLPPSQIVETLREAGLHSQPQPHRAAQETIDGERLRSALLHAEWNSDADVAVDASDEAIDSSVAAQCHETYCNAHRAFAPYFVNALDVACGKGRVDYAVEKLSEFARPAAGVKGCVREEAERALLVVTARMRLNDEAGPDLGAAAVARPGRLDHRDPVSLLAALNGAKQKETRDTAPATAPGAAKSEAELHAAWRRSAKDYELASELMAALNSIWSDAGLHAAWRRSAEIFKFIPPESRTALSIIAPDREFIEFSLYLDLLEAAAVYPAALVTYATLVEIRKSADARTLMHALSDWANSHPGRAVEALTLNLRAAALSGSQGSSGSSAFGNLLRTVGRRRAADIAFEEGTLLALRLPATSLLLLDGAHVWYGAADDKFNQLLTAIRIAMKYAEVGEVNGLRRWVEIARELYAWVHEGDPWLPAWAEFTDAASGAGVAPFVERLGARRNWRPWLVRLLGCVIISEPSEFRFRNLTALHEWVSANYGVDVGGRREVSPEFKFLYTPVKETLADKAWKLYASAKRAYTNSLPALRNAGLGLLGLSIVAAALFGFAKLVQFVAGKVSDSPVSFTKSFVWMLVVLAVVAALPRLFRLYVSMLLAVRPRVVSITADGKNADPNNPLASALKLTFSMLFLSLYRREETFPLLPSQGTSPEGAKPGDDPAAAAGTYRALASLLPKLPMRKWDTQVGAFYTEYHFVVDDKTAAAPWEALFGLSSDWAGKFGLGPLVCWRTTEVRRAKRPDEKPALPVQVKTFASALSHTDISLAGWGDFGGDEAAKYVHGAERPGLLLKKPRPEIGVAHFVGRVNDTSGRLTLDLGETDGPPLQAKDIADHLPNVKLCVVQLPPSEDPTRDAVCRYEAGLLRRFGADLFACGVPAVVVMPALNEQAVTAALKILGGWVSKVLTRWPRRWWHTWYPLPRAVREMQEAITLCYEDKEATIEIAFDVCVYADPYFTRSGFGPV